MGDDWDDDEWDADELLAQADKKKKGNWEEEEEDDDPKADERKKEEEERVAKAEAERKAREDEKAKKKAAVYVPLADPVQEKLRRQKLVEEADHALTSDLFDGFEKKGDSDATAGAKAASSVAQAQKKTDGPKVVVKDKFDDLELKTQKDIEDLCKVVALKVSEAKAKDAVGKLAVDLLKAVQDQIELKDLEALDKKLTTVIKAKKVEKTETEANKKKGNEKLNKNTKFNAADEMDVMYGGAAEDWDDQWEDWEEAGYAK